MEFTLDSMSLTGMASLLCLLAATQIRPTQAEIVPPKIEKFLKACEISRRGAILQLEGTLRALRRQSPATRETSHRAADLEEQLRVLRMRESPVVPQIAFPPQKGGIGHLPGFSCHVDQVVSNDELLVRCFFPVVVVTVERFQPRREKVVQPMRFLIRGLPTRDIDEGSDVEMLGVFEIVGKEAYRTVSGGSSNLFVLTEFDMKAVEPYFRKMAVQSRQ